MMSAHNVIRRISRSRVTALGLGAWLLCCALPAFATNVLQSVSHAPGANGRVDIILQFSDPIADAQVFTTDNPPRIAIDLPDTHNGLAQRRVVVGNGSASAVSAAEANGRTRVVVDLFRPAAYESRIEGNRLVLSVANSGAAPVAATAVPVGAMHGPILASSIDPSRRVAGALSVSNIDFRRGSNGAGRVVLRFSGPGASPDMHNEGSRVLIDVGNAMLPANLAKRIDVADFATPVQAIETRGQSGGTRLTINTNGAFESMAYQSGNEYVVEISPKKDASAVGARGMIGGSAAPVYHGKPATFNFQDVPVRTVLQLIAEESGLNVVASDSVQGNLTLRLINVPWDQALDIVLRAKGLDKRKDGDVIWIAPQKELADYEQARADARIALEQRDETVTEYLPINYGNAEDIAKLLTDESKSSAGASAAGGAAAQRGFLSPRGSVSFDRRTNTLLVIDIPKKVAEIKELVKLLDRPVDQVLIEGRIVIATEDFARDLGARFGVHGQQGNVVTSGSLESNVNYTNGLAANNLAMQAYQNQLATFNPSGCGLVPCTPPVAPSLPSPSFLFPGGLNVNLPFTPNAGAMALSILNRGLSLDLELSALQTEGRGEVISNPRVITSNQKEAIIRQGDQIGYSTTTTVNGVSQSTVAFKDAVLELKVTPTITNDGRVFMALDVKKDELAKFIHTSNGDVPQITTREVTTAVLVESGQTVVIGGVYEFKRREDLSKVPFLADLPLLGNLFKQTARSNTKAELLIFITPKILQFSKHN